MFKETLKGLEKRPLRGVSEGPLKKPTEKTFSGDSKGAFKMGPLQGAFTKGPI